MSQRRSTYIHLRSGISNDHSRRVPKVHGDVHVEIVLEELQVDEQVVRLAIVEPLREQFLTLPSLVHIHCCREKSIHEIQTEKIRIRLLLTGHVEKNAVRRVGLETK